MAWRACDKCECDWPDSPEYKTCPGCEAATRLSFAPHAPFEADAVARQDAHARFDRFYRRRERERTERGDMSPEALGRMEARQNLAEVGVS